MCLIPCGMFACTGRRYPITLDLEYRLRDGDRVLSVGTGRLKTISTSRLAFESASGLPGGVLVELVVSWPVRRPDCGIKLCIVGRTVGMRGNVTKVVILRLTFCARADGWNDEFFQNVHTFYNRVASPVKLSNGDAHKHASTTRALGKTPTTVRDR